MERLKQLMEAIFIIALVLGILSFFGALFAGCGTSTVYVPVETVKTEYKEVAKRDSIHLYDSIFVQMKNDTVWMEKYRYLYRDKIVRDSVFISDTIQVPYAVKGDTEYVNRLRWWQKLLMLAGGVALGFLAYKIRSLIKIK